VIKGMNIYKAHSEKKAATAALLSNEIEMLKNGYNPVAGKFIHQKESEVSADTLLFDALKFAASKFTGKSASDYKSILMHCQKAANGLGLHTLVIGNVKRRHIRAILDTVGEFKGVKWTPNNFNYYRSHLSVLFNKLLQYEAIEFNPIIGIAKAKKVQRIRPTLNRSQRHEVDQHLRKKGEMRFRLYMRLFFHSGIRSTEMLKLKGKDVDLNRQLLRVEVLKGGQGKEVLKPIKTIALRYWKLALKDCGQDQYVFSRHLKPGRLMIDAERITKRWYQLVKKPLGIDVDFYAFKHGNTTEMVDEVGIEAAALLNSHSGTGMVSRVYDTKRSFRDFAAVLAAKNEF
jgi:integrase